MSEAFVVHVAQLRRELGSQRHEVCRGPVDPAAGRPPGPADSTVPEGEDATCDVVLQSFPGGVMATGTVEAPWQGACRRCTASVGGTLRVPVRERFTEAGGTPEDEEAYPLVDDRIDLGELVHEIVVVALPFAPLCRLDCRGLCATCGTDLNESSCDCVAPRDPRWASLDVLRTSPGTAPAMEHVRERG